MDDRDSRSTIPGQEHWTNKGDLSLFLFEKSTGRPDPDPVYSVPCTVRDEIEPRD
jgi:hypothetical protein